MNPEAPLSKRERIISYLVLYLVKQLSPKADEETQKLFERLSHHLYVN